MSDPRPLLEAYLRQRQELGETELFLERHTAGALRLLLAPVSAEPGTVSPAPPAPTPRAVPAAPPATVAEIVRIDSLDALREVALGCTRCGLAGSRRNVVFGEGDPGADVMVVGEAPGAEEDRTGRPFVGAAGRMLDLLLAAVGFSREQVYICNVLKCRPPGNRNPQPEEVEACSPYLLRQVELIRPRVILACGTFAAQTLLRTSASIGRLRGEVHEFQGVPVVPTYHPAALLRNPAWGRATWEDLQRLRHVLETRAGVTA